MEDVSPYNVKLQYNNVTEERKHLEDLTGFASKFTV